MAADLAEFQPDLQHAEVVRVVPGRGGLSQNSRATVSRLSPLNRMCRQVAVMIDKLCRNWLECGVVTSHVGLLSLLEHAATGIMRVLGSFSFSFFYYSATT